MTQNLYQDLESRGILKQVTSPDLESRMTDRPLTLYCGFDPTSDSLHVGSLLPLLTLRRFQKAGHRVIAVVGGATGMIGDPSGKSQERSLLDRPTLDRNLKGITSTISKFLDLSGPHAARVVDNASWFAGLSYIDFLRDVGKHFTVNHMLAKESVRARLEDREHGISYTEFSYMLLQSYDFYHLYKTQGCELQIGGSDQWGNITAGLDLIRGLAGPESKAFGLIHPLVTKADGTKFGKSESGTIWIDAAKTSPYQFYQYFMQTADADVLTLIDYFTDLDLTARRALAEQLQKSPEAREAQRTLARSLTELVHGKAELERVEKASQALFSAEIRSLDAKTLRDAFSGAPSSALNREKLSAGYSLVDALVDTTLCNSKGNARKEIQAGGVYVNNERIQDPTYALTSVNVMESGMILLRRGKKTYHVLSLEGAD
ncbi:MAG: tyrosine--tRNA ligase [Bdellovibrionales bacterium]|nr:tyrosine--tRNA ligase [Bdellovibrionales bacterium]